MITKRASESILTIYGIDTNNLTLRIKCHDHGTMVVGSVGGGGGGVELSMGQRKMGVFGHY